MIRNRIAERRAQAGLTQEELARRAGVTRQTIISLEKNRYNPSLDLAFRVANILGASLPDIFSWEAGPD